MTNGDLEPADNPDAWKIFKVYVGETGLPLESTEGAGRLRVPSDHTSVGARSNESIGRLRIPPRSSVDRVD